MEGKPTRVRKEDCSATLLRVEDQDIEWQIEGINQDEGGLSEENLRDIAESYVAKVRMCWALNDQTLGQGAAFHKPPDRDASLNSPGAIFWNSDPPALEDDFWTDELCGSSSSYTNSMRTESVPTPACTTQCGLDPVWESKLDFDSDLAILLLEEDVM